MRFFTLLFLSLVATSSLSAQVQQGWAFRIYNVAPELGRAMTVDGSGNVYIAYGLAVAGASYDIKVLKFNSGGANLWTASYNGPANLADIASAIRVDGSGNVYVTGRTAVGNGYSDIITFKLNSSGAFQWVRTFNGPTNNNDFANAIAVDLSGNVYVTGTTSVTDFSPNFITLKYDNSGTLQWTRTYTTTPGGGHFAKRIAVDATGNVYVAGSSTDASGVYDFALIKYNSAGTQLFASRYNGPGNGSDEVMDMVVDGSGNAYLTGSVKNSSIDAALIKFNSSGVVQWARFYDGFFHGTDAARSVAFDAGGNIVIAGSITINGGSDYLTIKYNTSGTQQWAATYHGIGFDQAKMVRTDANGEIYVTGGAQQPGYTLTDITTVKYTATGARAWVISYTLASTSDVGTHLAVYSPVSPVFKPATLYVLGENSTGSGNDLTFVKYTQPQVAGKMSVLEETTGAFSINHYPNPFRAATTIRYTIPEAAYVSIKLYDVAGREVRQLVAGQQSAGDYSSRLSGDKLSAGIYHYTITAKTMSQEFIQTKSIVLSK